MRRGAGQDMTTEDRGHEAYDDRIDKTVDRTVKVALQCLNHPDLRWHTKNISHIGARTIFYDHAQGKECPCSIADLVLVNRVRG
jgi:hypothetical protein